MKSLTLTESRLPGSAEPKGGKVVNNDNDSFDCVVELIRARRAEQDAKWGGESHDDTHRYYDWIQFIRDYTESAFYAGVTNEPPNEYENRLIDIAALAVAAIQSHRRVSFMERQ